MWLPLLRFFMTSLHRICPYAQPFLCRSLKSCVIILSICVSEPVSMLANLTAILSRQQQLLEPWRGGRWRINKKKNVASYLQSSCVYPISGQADEWGREPHDKRSRYGAGAWMRDREGGRKSLSAMWGGRREQVWEWFMMREPKRYRSETEGRRVEGKKAWTSAGGLNLISLVSYI